MTKVTDQEYYTPNKGVSVSDYQAISITKLEQELDIINNGRLGNYDSQGNYFFDEDITEELINCTKYVSKYIKENPLRKGNDTYFLYTLLPGFEKLEFILEANSKSARLLLLEKVVKEGGEYFDIFEEEVINFDIDKKITIDYIIDKLHIINVDSDDGAQRDELLYVTLILLRKIYMKNLAELILNNSIQLEREQFEKSIAALKANGEYGNRILEKFVQRLKTRQDVVNKKKSPNYNRALNEILASVIYIETKDSDLTKKANKDLYSLVTEKRINRLAPILAENKKEVSAAKVKGAYFDLTHKDLADSRVANAIANYSNNRFVDLNNKKPTSKIQRPTKQTTNTPNNARNIVLEAVAAAEKELKEDLNVFEILTDNKTDKINNYIKETESQNNVRDTALLVAILEANNKRANTANVTNDQEMLTRQSTNTAMETTEAPVDNAAEESELKEEPTETNSRVSLSSTHDTSNVREDMTNSEGKPTVETFVNATWGAGGGNFISVETMNMEGK